MEGRRLSAQVSWPAQGSSCADALISVLSVLGPLAKILAAATHSEPNSWKAQRWSLFQNDSLGYNKDRYQAPNRAPAVSELPG